MLDPCDKCFLRTGRVGSDKNGVIPANIADNFGPITAVKGEGNTLRGQAYPLCVGAERGLQAERLAHPP